MKWIPLTERYPSVGKDVLITDMKQITLVHRDEDGFFGIPSSMDISEGFHTLGKYTHWMELPELPDLEDHCRYIFHSLPKIVKE